MGIEWGKHPFQEKNNRLLPTLRTLLICEVSATPAFPEISELAGKQTQACEEETMSYSGMFEMLHADLRFGEQNL